MEMIHRSNEDIVATERRHLLEGEQLVARQQALMEKLIERGNYDLVETANELLEILLESIDLSMKRLGELEDRLGELSEPN
jgi:hypothetical protein